MGKLDEAMVEFKHGTEIAYATMVTHPGDAPALSRLVRGEREMAAILASRGDSSGALLHAQRGVSIAQKYLQGPEPAIRKRYLGQSYLSVASIDRTFHKWPEARENAELAIAQWSPEVKDVDPADRERAAAIVAESSAHLSHK
jgi:hypothetical protein